MTNVELSDWLAANLPEDHSYKSYSGHRICDELGCADRGPAYYKEQALMVAIMLDAMASCGDTLSDLERGPIGDDDNQRVGWICNLFIKGKHCHFEGDTRYLACRAAAESVAEGEKP